MTSTGGDVTPPPRAAAAADEGSPASKRARVDALPPVVVNQSEHWNHEELVSQVQVLKAELLGLKAGVVAGFAKHNFLVSEVDGAISGLSNGLAYADAKTEEVKAFAKKLEQGCVALETETKRLSGLGREYEQRFVNDRIQLEALRCEYAEKLNYIAEHAKKFESRLEVFEFQAIPSDLGRAREGMVQELQKLKAELEANVPGALTKAIDEKLAQFIPQNFEERLMDAVEQRLNNGFDSNLKGYIEAQATQVKEDVVRMMGTSVDVTATEFRLVNKELADVKGALNSLSAAGSKGTACPCTTGNCPCKCSADPFATNCPWSAGAAAAPSAGLGAQTFELNTPPSPERGRGWQRRDGGDPGGGGGGGSSPPHRPPGLPRAGAGITLDSRLFDEKTAKEQKFAYDGEANGASWRSDVVDYIISRCPDAEPWLEWIELQGSKEITAVSMGDHARDGPSMTEFNPFVLSHHMWGFLQHGVSGAARQLFKAEKRRDGFNVWRLLVLEINSQTDCRRHGLRVKVQNPAQVGSNGGVKKGLAD